jgi:hypothetical protein
MINIYQLLRLLFESNFTLLIVFLISFWKFLSQVIETKVVLLMNSCISLVFSFVYDNPIPNRLPSSFLYT